MYYTVEPASVGDATVTVPGDKSISHRALMLGAIAEGDTQVSGFLAGEDCLATLGAFRRMGVAIERPEATTVEIKGVGRSGLTAPETELDLGNSGTAMRLMAGLLSGQPFHSILTGDTSLTGRPMQRVITPLEQMGARIDSRDGKPPLAIHGRCPLDAVHYHMPVASAQVKSALLLAGLYAGGETTVVEPAVTRDHTERMLGAMGVRVARDGGRISIAGGQSPGGRALSVPADLSSATFVILAALLSPRADVLIRNVGVNPTRTGVLQILKDMGAELTLENEGVLGEEPVADIRVRASKLTGGAVDPGLVSLAIDEFPALFVAAAAAEGETVFSGLEELRVKESDRIAAMAAGLGAIGVEVQELADGAIVRGGRFRSGTVESHGDHRVAMALAVAGTIADGPVTVRDVAAVDTSFPGFAALMNDLGAAITVGGEDAP